MALTFAGRFCKVTGQSDEKCREVAKMMITAWKKQCKETYQSLERRYLMAKCWEAPRDPTCMELRKELHSILRNNLERVPEFRFSELVDLTMFYFNNVASFHQ